jgi:hypothetical protein
MVDREKFNHIIEGMAFVSSHYPQGDFEKSVQQVIELRDHFDIKLMLVGHFSAGKSSLLNVMIHKPNFLKEAQGPQTAIATELLYDESDSAYAYDIDGNKEIISEDKEYSPINYNHLEYRINSPVLQKLNDFTIVDTPGFDAGIEAHTKALANYIGKGSAYLMVIDQEKGGIDQTSLDFLQEISNYSQQIAVLINKCDKITKDDVDSIAEAARATLEMYDLPYSVFTVSKKDRDISDKLVSIISSFKAQDAFDKVLKTQICTELVNIEKILSITSDKIYLDTFDLDADILMYKRIEEQLSDIFETKRQEAHEDLSNVVLTVISSIKSALSLQAESIVEALLTGNKVAAEAIIVETIRPVMFEAMKEISSSQIDGIVETLDFTGLGSELEQRDLAEVALNLANNLKGIFQKGNFDTKAGGALDILDKSKYIYHAVMGIAAITTSVVAPWLEIIIVILPDIIGLLRGIFGESEVDVAKRKFVNNVIPQIAQKLYPMVEQNVKNTTNIVLEEYQKMLNEKIEQIKKNLSEAEAKKNQKTEEFERYKCTLSSDLEHIKELSLRVRK